MQNNRLSISFSGGRTSAYMLARLLAEVRSGAAAWTEIVVLFANTGQEDERTLAFVDRVDRTFGASVVWLEAVIDPAPKAGTRHRVVDFSTATRDGSLFAAFSRKYGLPSVASIGCTRELKLHPMKSYLRSIGWGPGTYDQAIGIRADEMDRVSDNAARDRLVYPLVHAGVTKREVLDWWARRPFDLNIPEHFGNCVWCYKKSDRKLATVARECPQAFDVPRALERDFAHAGPLAAKTGTAMRIFRKGKTVDDIFDLAAGPVASWKDVYVPTFPLADTDEGGACGESCEVYADGVDDGDWPEPTPSS